MREPFGTVPAHCTLPEPKSTQKYNAIHRELRFKVKPLNGLSIAIVGDTVSRLTVTDAVLEPPPLVAAQVNVTPSVSLVTALAPQPCFDVMTDSASVTCQATDTLERYQPLSPSLPVIVGVITGGVVSLTAVTVYIATADAPRFPARSVGDTVKLFVPGVAVSIATPLATVPTHCAAGTVDKLSAH
jgi:hypothetical protein